MDAAPMIHGEKTVTRSRWYLCPVGDLHVDGINVE